MRKIAGSVYVEDKLSVPPYDRGCNPGFVSTSEGVVMIDCPMMPTDCVKWRQEIEKHGQVRYIINTHHHPDHMAGNYFFPGTVISHEKVKAVFSTPLTHQVVSQTGIGQCKVPARSQRWHPSGSPSRRPGRCVAYGRLLSERADDHVL